MDDGPRYYEELAAAFVRGRLGLTGGTDAEVIARGQADDLKLHKFKRQAELPRVKRVLGVLRGLAPEDLLDVGSGRGTFLWPLVDGLPWLPVVAVDQAQRRVQDLQAVRKGGVERLSAVQMDACSLALKSKSRDVVTILEVLEHLERPERAAAEGVRVARRFVVASVPAHEDENPEHLRLFDERALGRLFESAGATRVSFERVLNHIIAVVRL
ncbi:MAG TPA: methyltransferase domain-containing protein [Myxococcales bacterium]|jgi:ubiquinone/menaquinone biosynthesis C-methylase UbiE